MLKYLYPPFHLLVITYFYNKPEDSTILVKYIERTISSVYE
jgi:hypothetical protein